MPRSPSQYLVEADDGTEMLVGNGYEYDRSLLKLLVHSPAGHGKTRLIGTILGDPRFMPALLCDFEGGSSTIASRIRRVTLEELEEMSTNKTVPTDKIICVRIKAWNDLNLIYAILEEGQFRTVALDSLSEIHYLSLSEVLVEELKKKPSRDPDVAEQHDYLKSLSQMRKMVRFFRDLDDMHVIFTATSMDQEDARTRRGQVRPNLIGKLSGELSALLDYVGYLGIIEDKEKTTRVLCTAASERFVAKARNDEDAEFQLEGELLDPTLPKVLDQLQGLPRNGK